MADAKLSNSSVTSSAIRLRGARVTFAWKNLTEEEPLPSLFASTDAQSEVQFMGWLNPSYTITGVLDESSDRLTDGISLSLIKSFAKATTSTYFIDDEFAPSGTKVVIPSFTVIKSASDRDDKIYNYSIKLTETL